MQHGRRSFWWLYGHTATKAGRCVIVCGGAEPRGGLCPDTWVGRCAAARPLTI
eukprot:gene11918-3888_t